MNQFLKNNLLLLTTLTASFAPDTGNDTSKETIVYGSKFFDSEKSILEANQKRYRKAVKQGFTGTFEEFRHEKESI